MEATRNRIGWAFALDLSIRPFTLRGFIVRLCLASCCRFLALRYLVSGGYGRCADCKGFGSENVAR